MHQRDGADPDDQRSELMFQLSKSAWLRITRPPYGPGEIETVDGSPRVCRGGGPIGSKVAAGHAARPHPHGYPTAAYGWLRRRQQEEEHEAQRQQQAAQAERLRRRPRTTGAPGPQPTQCARGSERSHARCYHPQTVQGKLRLAGRRRFS
jgi:hypothetical protein